jgi:hypothetical protein
VPIAGSGRSGEDEARRRWTVGWWVVEKGAPAQFFGPTEINQEAAKKTAAARSRANPGTVFEVRYHVNANAAPETRWEALDGAVREIGRDAPKHF